MNSSILALALTLSLFGCDKKNVPAEPSAIPESKTVSSKEPVYPDGTNFDKSDNGKDVVIAVGTTITVTLKEDPNSPFKWGVLENNKSIFEVTSEDSKLVNGANNTNVQSRVFTFKATKTGKSNLKIVYFPIGTQDHAGETQTDSFRLNIVIQ